jgi:hypothetical protein
VSTKSLFKGGAAVAAQNGTNDEAYTKHALKLYLGCSSLILQKAG